jgi:hypothetical protein
MGADRVTLTAAGELALRRGTRMLEPAEVEAACAAAGVGHDAFVSAVQALKRDELIAVQIAEPSVVVLAAITDKGLARHLRATRPDLAEFERRLWDKVEQAVEQGPTPLAEEVGEPALLVEWMLDRWVTERRLVYSKAPGRRFRIHKVLRPLPGARPAAAEPAP